MEVQDKYPVGTRLRMAHPSSEPGMLFHVRGHVDGLLVIRTWVKHKIRWAYEVTNPEITIEAVKLYTVEDE